MDIWEKGGPIMMIRTPDNGDMSFNYENNVLTVFFDIPYQVLNVRFIPEIASN